MPAGHILILLALQLYLQLYSMLKSKTALSVVIFQSAECSMCIPINVLLHIPGTPAIYLVGLIKKVWMGVVIIIAMSVRSIQKPVNIYVILKHLNEFFSVSCNELLENFVASSHTIFFLILLDYQNIIFQLNFFHKYVSLVIP